MPGMPIDKNKALEIVILFITTHPEIFNQWLSEYYLGDMDNAESQNMFVPGAVWDVMTDTAQRIVNELVLLRNGKHE